MLLQWTDGHHLLGIHFANIIPRRRVELTEVIDEMEAAAAARAQAVNQLVAEQTALIPASCEIPKAVAAGPVERIAAKANQPQIVVKASDPPAKPANRRFRQKSCSRCAGPANARDRRRQIRHEVDTLATLF